MALMIITMMMMMVMMMMIMCYFALYRPDVVLWISGVIKLFSVCFKK